VLEGCSVGAAVACGGSSLGRNFQPNRFHALEEIASMIGQQRIALFIDGANLYATTKTLGFDIDYKRLLKEFQSRGHLVRAFITPPWSKIRSIPPSGR
jgi:hypothetical protein